MCKISIESIQKINQEVMDDAKKRRISRVVKPVHAHVEPVFPDYGYGGFYLTSDRVREISRQAWEEVMSERAALSAAEVTKAKTKKHGRSKKRAATAAGILRHIS